jgi:subtilisin family serine protease
MKPSAVKVAALLALGLGGAMLVSTARGQDAQPPPRVCIVPPLLFCPPSAPPPPPPSPPPRSPPPVEPEPPREPQPDTVTPTYVRYDEHRILIRVRRGTTRKEMAGALERAGVVRERRLRKIRFEVVLAQEGKRDQALAALRRERSVAAVERETLVDALDVDPNDPFWSDQWGLRLTHFPKGWSVTRGSSRVVVAVLDTGVDATQPDLRGAVGAGYDFVNADSDPRDDNGHGTAVAGVVAARGGNGIGLAGACWACTIMPIKVLDEDGSGNTAAIAAGILWAVDHGANVINLSLGGPGATDVLSGAVRYALGRNVVVVAAAGNNGSTTAFYPAALPSVLGVAATTAEDQLYSWSNHGPWVEVAAPGCNVAPWPGATYVDFCGTSSATPLVSGLAALYRAARPEATVTETLSAVEKAVVPVAADVRRGRVDAGLAIPPQSGAPNRSDMPSVTALKLRGILDRKASSRIYSREVGAGRIVARLTFRPGLRLALWLSMKGRPITRASGSSPLGVVATVPAGTIRLLVAGRHKPASFTLTVSHVKP